MSPVLQETLATERGDTLVVTLVALLGDRPSILVSLDDADALPVPTAELTLGEAVELREILRRFAEAISLEDARRRSWTTKR